MRAWTSCNESTLRSLATTLVVALCLTLAGCWSRPLDTRIFARNTISSIELLFCESAEVTFLSVTRSHDHDDEQTWAGSIDWKSSPTRSLVLSAVGDAPKWLVGGPLDRDERLSFALHYSQPPGGERSTGGTVFLGKDLAEWPVDAWIGTDGRAHSDPCGSE